MGDSHVALGINDRLFSNLLNVASHGEGYIYTYYKLRALKASNPSINCIFLGVSYHNFSNYSDERIFSQSSIDKYYYLLPEKERIHVLRKTGDPLSCYIQCYSNRLKQIINHENTTWLGKFIPFDKEAHQKGNENSVAKRIAYHFYDHAKIRKFSESNLYYLKKIIEYCKEKKIRMIVINTPLKNDYKRNVPKKMIDRYVAFIHKYNLEVENFRKLELNSTNFIPDGDHVSPSGADSLTKYMHHYYNGIIH